MEFLYKPPLNERNRTAWIKIMNRLQNLSIIITVYETSILVSASSGLVSKSRLEYQRDNIQTGLNN